MVSRLESPTIRCHRVREGRLTEHAINRLAKDHQSDNEVETAESAIRSQTLAKHTRIQQFQRKHA